MVIGDLILNRYKIVDIKYNYETQLDEVVCYDTVLNIYDLYNQHELRALSKCKKRELTNFEQMAKDIVENDDVIIHLYDSKKCDYDIIHTFKEKRNKDKLSLKEERSKNKKTEAIKKILIKIKFNKEEITKIIDEVVDKVREMKGFYEINRYLNKVYTAYYYIYRKKLKERKKYIKKERVFSVKFLKKKKEKYLKSLENYQQQTNELSEKEKNVEKNSVEYKKIKFEKQKISRIRSRLKYRIIDLSGKIEELEKKNG